jgi:hypothetical protein
VSFNKSLCLFLVITIWEVNSLIVERKEGDNDTVSALFNGTNRYSCPLCSIFRGCSVAVVTVTKKKYSKLQLDRQLRAVGVVGKDGVVEDEHDKAIKGLWVNTDLAVKTFRTMDPPAVKKVNLCRLWHRGA